MANLNVVAMKPRDNAGNLFVVVDRGAGHDHQFVSASANARSLASGEWFWGHYFKSQDEALAHFNAR